MYQSKCLSIHQSNHHCKFLSNVLYNYSDKLHYIFLCNHYNFQYKWTYSFVCSRLYSLVYCIPLDFLLRVLLQLLQSLDYSSKPQHRESAKLFLLLP